MNLSLSLSLNHDLSCSTYNIYKPPQQAASYLQPSTICTRNLLQMINPLTADALYIRVFIFY